MTDVSLDRDALRLFEDFLEAAPAEPQTWLATRTSDRPDLLARVNRFIEAERTIVLLTVPHRSCGSGWFDLRRGALTLAWASVL